MEKARHLPPSSPQPHGRARELGFLALALALINLLLYGDLMLDGSRNLSHHMGDGSLYFQYMRDFASREMLKGNLPLWNPHILSGTPFLGNFQSALFYPFNLVYLVLPTPQAMNIDMVFHGFLSGIFMFLWARARSLSWSASFLTGAIFMLGSSITPRIMAGQLTMLAATAWAPCIFLCADKIISRTGRTGIPLGWFGLYICSLSMQNLAGHPQTAFITWVALGLYCAMRISSARRKVACFSLLVAGVIWAGMVAAAQILPGLEVSAESLRSDGVPIDFATSFSLTPESFLTLLVPDFFGDPTLHPYGHPYFGRWAFWDSVFYFSIGGLLLAVQGVVSSRVKSSRLFACLAIVFVVLAVGRYTPLYGFAHTWIPGFALFRSPSKFLLPASMFVCMLAGIGLDSLKIERNSSKRATAIASLLLAALLALVAFLVGAHLFPNMASAWREWIFNILLIDEVWMALDNKTFLDQTASFSLLATSVATALLSLGVVLLWRSPRVRWAPYALLILALIESMVFARSHRVTFETTEAEIRATEYAERANEEGSRVYVAAIEDHRFSNAPMRVGAQGVWGYEPVKLARYAGFMSAALGGLRHHDLVYTGVKNFLEDPLARALDRSIFGGQTVIALENLPLLRLTGCKYVLTPFPNAFFTPEVLTIDDPLPAFQLLFEYETVQDRQTALNQILAPGFDPEQRVILEEEPLITPGSPKSDYEIMLIDSSTDHSTLVIDNPEPGILLLTKSYSEAWTVSPAPGSTQQNYSVLAANYAFIGIPLESGHHEIRVEYQPRSFRLGCWLSALSISLLLVLLFVAARRRNPALRTTQDQETPA